MSLPSLRMLERFVIDICECEALWTPAKIIEDAVERLRVQVGNDKVILGLSGGVDSHSQMSITKRSSIRRPWRVWVTSGWNCTP